MASGDRSQDPAPGPSQPGQPVPPLPRGTPPPPALPPEARPAQPPAAVAGQRSPGTAAAPSTHTTPEPTRPASAHPSGSTGRPSDRTGATPVPPTGTTNTTTGQARGRRPTLWPLAALLLSAVILALALSWLRVAWVRDGSLYGDEPVWQINVVAGALWALSALIAAGLALAWSRRRRPPAESDWRDTFDIATRLTVAGTVVAAFVAVVNTWAPVTPSDIAAAACPGATLWQAPYIGVTAVDGAVTSGVNTRQGPGRSHSTNGRFLEQCAVGFSAFCLGDPIEDAVATTDHAAWDNSRWLLLNKHRSARARLLSGENRDDQFLSEVLINPIRSYTAVPYRGDKECHGGRSYPGRTTLDPFDPQTATLRASATDATNMGFAVWIPPGQAIAHADSYTQIYNSAGKPADNPGRADGSGAKSVSWDYQDTVVTELRGDPVTANGEVVVMAIACLAVNVPADPNTAAMATYRVSRASGPTSTNGQIPAGLDRHRLANAACQAII